MPTDPFEQLNQEFQDINAVYEQEFAGLSRQTRDLERLDSLLGQLRGLLTRIKQAEATAQGKPLARLRSDALEALSTYESERTAIVEAKASGPDQAEFMLLGTLANQVFARYSRHFAGQSRATRDVGLLDEMVTDLRAIRQRMREVAKKKEHPAFDRDIDLVGQQIEMYTREREAIVTSQQDRPADERASLLAALANAQFELYRTHFAGRARATRRPALLQRIIERLRHLRAAMLELERGGLDSEPNARNAQIVAQNLATYEAELEQVKASRKSASMRELTSMLGGAANEIFDQYRASFAGRDRAQVDPALLSSLCDLLGEIARQMADFHRVQKEEINAKNLDIVNAQLAAYEREYVQVADTHRRGAAGAAGAAGGASGA